MLDAENGPRIDQFGTIVRFNRFETQGYEKHVGSKTDVLFSGLEAQHLGWRLTLPFRAIYAHSWATNPERCPTLSSFREHLPKAEVVKIDHSTFQDMARYADTSYRVWSTGAIALWMMAWQFPVVHLTGFDWWARQEHHYFNPKANRGKLHKPEEEKRFVERMMAEGRACFL